MSYELYTFPNCGHCQEVKEFLDASGVDCEEINLGKKEGRKRFNDFYPQKRDSIQRDDKGMILVPVLVERNDSGIVAVTQSIDNIKELFGK